MSMITKCPSCGTTFRVTPQQLQAQHGMVRCGRCAVVFDGFKSLATQADDSLRETAPANTVRHNELCEVDSPASPTVSGGPTDTLHPLDSASVQAPSADATAEHAVVAVVPAPVPLGVTPLTTPVAENASPAPANPASAPREASYETATPESPTIDFLLVPDNPEAAPPEVNHESAPAELPEIDLLLMPAVDPQIDSDRQAEAAPANPEIAPAVTSPAPPVDDVVPPADSGATETMPALPEPPAEQSEVLFKAEIPGAAQPAVVADAQARPADVRFEAAPLPRRRRGVMAFGIFILLLTLAAQGIYFYRGEIAANVPEARPYLNRLCEQLRCTVALPQQPRSISIEASDLQAIDPANPGLIVLTTTLRNQAATVLGYPAIDVVLTNAKEHTVARRIFLPGEYLAAGKDVRAGFAPNAEMTIKLTIDSGDLGAAGFRLDLLAAPAQ